MSPYAALALTPHSHTYTLATLVKPGSNWYVRSSHLILTSHTGCAQVCVCVQVFLCKYVSFSISVFPCACPHLHNCPEFVFLPWVDVWLTERQIEVYEHLCFHSESNLQHIKGVWLVLCSLLKSLNTLFNHTHKHTQTHTHTHTHTSLAASAVSVPRSKMNACQRDAVTRWFI